MFNKRDKKDKKKKKEKKKIIARKRACRFCVDKEIPIDYKMARFLGQYITERGRIVPRRMCGNCAFHQRRVVEAIKQARHLALIPYTITHAQLAA